VHTVEGDVHSQLLRENFIAMPTAVIRKECLEKAGLFDEQLRNLEDWELFLRLSQECRVALVREPLVESRALPDGINKRIDLVIRSTQHILEKHAAEFARDPKWYAWNLYNVGILLCGSGRTKEGRKYLWKAARTNARWPRPWVALPSSILGGWAAVRANAWLNRMGAGKR
jgi:hypothetical protein